MDSASGESQLLEFEGWTLELPAAATTEILVPDWPKTVGFYTEDFGGALTVAHVPPEGQASFRPLHAVFGALTKVTPMAARFFFATGSGVGLEVRGEADSGRRTYIRMYATRESAMTLALTPADASDVHAVVASLKRVE